MKRTELAITLILALLLSLAAGLPVIEEAKANPYGMTLMMWRDKIVVESPQNKTYNVETLAVNFTVEYMEANELHTGYILNNQKPVYVSPTVVSTKINTGYIYTPSTSQNTTFKITIYIGQYNFLLPNLADGTYNLTLVRTRGSATVIFTIDTTSGDTAVIPEFPSWIILPLFLIVTLFAIIIKKKAFARFVHSARSPKEKPMKNRRNNKRRTKTFFFKI